MAGTASGRTERSLPPLEPYERLNVCHVCKRLGSPSLSPTADLCIRCWQDGRAARVYEPAVCERCWQAARRKAAELGKVVLEVYEAGRLECGHEKAPPQSLLRESKGSGRG